VLRESVLQAVRVYSQRLSHRLEDHGSCNQAYQIIESNNMWVTDIDVGHGSVVAPLTFPVVRLPQELHGVVQGSRTIKMAGIT
jgi:hypothetical protein